MVLDYIKRNAFFVAVLVGFFLAYYFFKNVLVYVSLAIVLSLIGNKIIDVIERAKIGGRVLPRALTAAFALFCINGLLIGLVNLFLPVIIDEVKALTQLNMVDVLSQLTKAYPESQFTHAYQSFFPNGITSTDVEDFITKRFSAADVQNYFNLAISMFSSLLGAFFSVNFIAFFLLKDEFMLYKIVLLLSPDDKQLPMQDIMRTSKTLLSKYFAGLFLDVLIVSSLVTIGMYAVGVPNALMIGIFAGIFNIIPYVGPIATAIFALFIGVSGALNVGDFHNIGNIVFKTCSVLLAINLVDAILIQPFIFANTVKAHPLEIFLVILIAASLGGIVGMIIAIPLYTLLRIIAKEFLTSFKFFEQLTKGIPD